jgi:hypothetical protein
MTKTIAFLFVFLAPMIGRSQGVSAEIVAALIATSDGQIKRAGTVLAPPMPQPLNQGANDEWRDITRTRMIRFLKAKYAPSASQAIPGFQLPDKDILTWTWAQKPERLWYYDLEGSSGVLYQDGTTSSITTDANLKSIVLDRIRRVLNLPDPTSTRQHWYINRVTLPSGKELAYGRLVHNITLLPDGSPTTPANWDSNFAWWTDGYFVYFDWAQINLSVPATGGNKVQRTSKTVRLIGG